MTPLLVRIGAVLLLALSFVGKAYAIPSDDTGSNSGISTNDGTSGGPIHLLNPLGTTDLMALILGILDFITKVIGPIVIILMLVYIGFLFTTTSVNPENKQKAKEYLLWTVVGALILLGAEAIMLGIQATVNSLAV